MYKLIDRERDRRERTGVGGIMVRTGWTGEDRPPAAVFVWGQELRHAPSLPFGRWKAAVRPAA